MRTFTKLLTLVALFSNLSCHPISQTNTLDPEKWQRVDKHDGYVIGNGKMYLVAGLGKELGRNGKTSLSDKETDLTRIDWIIGPTYTIGNLGYGWDIIPIIDHDTIKWEKQQIISPGDKYNFWGVNSVNKEIQIINQDIILTDQTVFIREIKVKKPEGSKTGLVRIKMPVYPDPRNAIFAMFDGSEVDMEQVEEWKHYCGPNLKPRSSVSAGRLMKTDPETGSIVLIGANRALWQDWTRVPSDDDYEKMFPYRAAATGVKTDSKNIIIDADRSGFSIELGTLKSNDSCTIYVYVVTEKGAVDQLEEKTLTKLNEWKQKDAADLVRQSIRNKPESFFTKKNDENNPLIQSINSCIDLCLACKPDFGGVMAQPYMYPMYYVRDQFGPFRLLLAAGEYSKVYGILQFYIANQNHTGIQNAYDWSEEPKDLYYWDPEANEKNGLFAKAEVPSYIILMAREYYHATGDLAAIEPYYNRLKYNLNIQRPSKNGVLPYGTDESYTNTITTKPKFSDEMTDSHLLYLAAAKFMNDLAIKLNKKEDAEEFDSIYQAAKEVLFQRMWLNESDYFVFARDTSSNPQNIDRRPAFDALLRWSYLEIGDPSDSVSQGNLNTVINKLTDPVRVVPEKEWCAGMDMGYLLYAMSRCQHPLTDNAATLLLKYASDQGLYSEYYSYKHDTIVSDGGTLRPWESAVNGYVLIKYLTGLRLNMPEKKIYLQPHLPKGWSDWKSKNIPLYNEGEIQMELKKTSDEISFTIRRKGGVNPIDVDLEFGLFGKKLIDIGKHLKYRNSDQNLLFSEFTISASNIDWTESNFRFKVVDKN